MLLFTVKESGEAEAAWLEVEQVVGGRAGSKLVRMQPEDPLSQPAVVREEPAEEQSAWITTEEVLVMNEAYLNVSFSGERELQDGASGSEGERGGPQRSPPAGPSPQVPSEKPAATDREVSSDVSVCPTKVDVKELNCGGRRVPSGPGKSECIPLLTRAQRLRGAGPGSATAKAHPVSTPEAAIEAFFQLLGRVALPEPAVDARILLEDQAVVAATFAALFGDEEAKLFTPEKRSEDGPGAVEEEAL